MSSGRPRTSAPTLLETRAHVDFQISESCRHMSTPYDARLYATGKHSSLVCRRCQGDPLREERPRRRKPFLICQEVSCGTFSDRFLIAALVYTTNLCSVHVLLPLPSSLNSHGLASLSLIVTLNSPVVPMSYGRRQQ